MKREQWAAKLLRDSRIAHMATTTKLRIPHIIPVCYVFTGRTIYSSIDLKPKRVAPNLLRRIKNIIENPHVAFVVDVYSEDWSDLRYVLVQGTAETISTGLEHKRAVALLRKKYPQYRKMHLAERPVIRVTPLKIVSWRSDLKQ